MAKGGIIDDHILILPIAHHASSLDLPDDTAMECLVYKQAVIKAMKSIGKQCIFFERNYRTDHMQIQVSSQIQNRIVASHSCNFIVGFTRKAQNSFKISILFLGHTSTPKY